MRKTNFQGEIEVWPETTFVIICFLLLNFLFQQTIWEASFPPEKLYDFYFQITISGVKNKLKLWLWYSQLWKVFITEFVGIFINLENWVAGEPEKGRGNWDLQPVSWRGFYTNRETPEFRGKI